MVCQDLPDYTRKMIIEYTGGFVGLEELATRLGFIAPFNLQGNVVLMEDFETEETEWTLAIDGAPSAAGRQSRHKYSGNWSIYLHSSVAGGAFARAYRYFPFPHLVKHGLFCRIKFDQTAGDILFQAYFDDGTWYYGIGVDYRRDATSLRINNSAGGIIILDPAFTLGGANLEWHNLLVTFDLSTMMYDRLYFGDRTIDISMHSFGRVASAFPRESSIIAQVARVAAVTSTAYFDDIVLVENIP